MVLTMPPFFSAEGWCFFSREKYGAFKPLVEKVERTRRINASIERVFGCELHVSQHQLIARDH